jgi:hypothetical protein
MIDNTVRMVLLPRYTALYGTSPLYSAPFNVKRFARVVLTAWAGVGLGSLPPGVGISIEQSTDLEHWHTAGVVGPDPDSEKTSVFDLLDMEWARTAVVVTPEVGEPPGATVWAVGAFVLREGM